VNVKDLDLRRGRGRDLRFDIDLLLDALQGHNRPSLSNEMTNAEELDPLADKGVEVPTAFIRFLLSIVVEPFQGCYRGCLIYS
jgi:hypothetical protein